MYSYTPIYYEAPTQVRYWWKGAYHGGIGYHDIIIHGQSGERVAIQTVIDEGELLGNFWDDIIVELEWLDLDKPIMNLHNTKKDP